MPLTYWQAALLHDADRVLNSTDPASDFDLPELLAELDRHVVEVPACHTYRFRHARSLVVERLELLGLLECLAA